MKIAIVYDAVYPYVKGGAEKRIYELSKVLSKKHEIYLFGMKYWNGSDVIKAGNVYLHGVCNSTPLYRKNGRRSLIQPFYFSFYLLKELLKHDFDIIDCQNFPYIPCFACKFYSLLRKKPLIITWVETINKGFIGIIERSCYLLTKNHLFLTNNARYKSIPAGIDLEKINHVKPNKDKFDIIFVGRLIKDKRVDLLLLAVKDLNLKIAIIGDGPEKNRLISLAHELGLDNVFFKGFLDKDEDIYSYMKSSKMLVLPSVREGFGIVVLEALACGCKVITSNHEKNNSKDFVDERFICDVDVESLRDKIKFGLKNRYRNRINLKDFEVNKISGELEEYYRKVHEV